MEAAIKQNRMMNLSEEIVKLSGMFRISMIEKLLSDSLETLPQNSPVNYIGELNKNDVFH